MQPRYSLRVTRYFRDQEMAKIENYDGADENTGLRAPIGWWQKWRQFLTEVRSEMKRVTWPSQKEVYATTVIVILTSVFFGLYLFGVDLLLSSAVQRVFQRFGAA